MLTCPQGAYPHLDTLIKNAAGIVTGTRASLMSPTEPLPAPGVGVIRVEISLMIRCYVILIWNVAGS